MAQEREFQAQNKVKRRSAWYGPLTITLLAVVAVLVVSLSFRVSTIEVVNATEYTDAQIVAASGIEKGANLFFVDRFSAASLIFSNLNYMETVSIQRELPNKIIIQAEGTAACAYMQIDGEYWFIDRRGQTLGAASLLEAEKFPEVRGITVTSPIESEPMNVDSANAEKLLYARDILSALIAEEMTDEVEWIDMSSGYNPCLYYGGRLTVYLGLQGDSSYRIAQLKNVLTKLSEDDTGTLYFNEANSWTFSPD